MNVEFGNRPSTETLIPFGKTRSAEGLVVNKQSQPVLIFTVDSTQDVDSA
jgi:hypothetical protein